MEKIFLRLRRLGEDDLPALYRIERESFSDPWSFACLQDELDRPCSVPLGIFREGALLGYSFSWLVLGECHLLSLAVKKEERGRGLGRRLLKAVFNLARAGECGRIHLEVSERNPAALALYESSGFRRVGRRKGYYKDGSDAILMTLELRSGEGLANT
ncbi:MAG: ribosomal protein S18-alanine N-acetyltransferase [Deltaproteobacteria bacterium]|jgi:ribosomal-protein-alanine N-acetyltransferase|nr:ribosomal protein S18-alanine N-acetyltransferase [Deltaproteobacteria bacterium]